QIEACVSDLLSGGNPDGLEVCDALVRNAAELVALYESCDPGCTEELRRLVDKYLPTKEEWRSHPQLHQPSRPKSGRILSVQTRTGRGRRSSPSTSSTLIPMYGRYPGGSPRFATHAFSSFTVNGSPGLFSRRTLPL